jgi:hypothetical protein
LIFINSSAFFFIFGPILEIVDGVIQLMNQRENPKCCQVLIPVSGENASGANNSWALIDVPGAKSQLEFFDYVGLEFK